MLERLLNDWVNCRCVIMGSLKISRVLIERHGGRICRFSGMKMAECDYGWKRRSSQMRVTVEKDGPRGWWLRVNWYVGRWLKTMMAG